MQTLLQEKKKRLVKFLAEKQILVEPDFLNQLNSLEDPQKISDLVNKKTAAVKVPGHELKKADEAGRGLARQPPAGDSKVKIIFSYKNEAKKTTAQDFITHFTGRYNILKKMLQQRIQLENVVSIGKLKGKSEREKVSVIGMVQTKDETKNGVMLTIEDPTGQIKVFFSKNKQDTIAKANDAVLDEVIGLSGSMGKNIIFANELYFPEVPAIKEIKKAPVEEYAVFISDMHIGSKAFLEADFLKFISWLRGETGNDKQKELASKARYLFITGDAIDGISIVPFQKERLNILTFREQYQKLAEYLKLVPKNIKIILCPGQHDIVPIAEPQPALPEEYCKELYEMPNMIFVSNPAIVNIASSEGFPGFDVLMYHGAAYNYYADKVESIRIQKPNISERAEAVMRLLLQKRHLAPTYDSSPHIPTEKDNLIIERIPDIIVSGDVHRPAAFSYKGGITGIIGACFQAKTPFQDKVGHVPDPGRVPILNLKTRDVKILNFRGGK